MRLGRQGTLGDVRRDPYLRAACDQRRRARGAKAFPVRRLARNTAARIRAEALINRRRFDHIFASERLKTISCEYLTSWLDDRLSDHAGIEAVIEAK